MTEGSISQKIIFFAIPLFLGNLFQQLYNTADSLIVGNFLGSNALAAVSSSGNLIFLMVGFINGIAMGAGVVIARYYGAKKRDCLKKAIHTTVAFGLVAGAALTVLGMLLAPKILVLMGTPADVLPESIVYFRTYFAGSMGVVMYNIFVGVLQSVGDGRHPLIYLIISSCVNVVLDIFFIAGLGMGVGSAALATAISQFVSALLCMVHLLRVEEEYRLELREIRFDSSMLKQIIQNGVPSGFQNSVIAIANVFVQSNINAFGKMAKAGIVRTKDLVEWERLPDLKSYSQQRNVVLHPEFVNGKYALYTRPQDDFINAGNGGGIGWALIDDITQAEVKEEIIINHRYYHTIKEVKNGEGPHPIKTSAGWLHLAHGVRACAAGLRYVLYLYMTALDEPWKLTAEPAGYFLAPLGSERVGDVSNVLFSNGWIADEDGTVYIYYASSDTRMHVVTSTIDKLVDYCMHTPADGLRSATSVDAINNLIDKNETYLNK